MMISHSIRQNFQFEPTSSQAELFDTLDAFISGDTGSDIMLVSGYAGTGKTSAISAFISTLKTLERKFVLMAPTGRAAKVLASYSRCSAYTIHKTIYLQKTISGEGGEPAFVLGINKNSNTCFIVDEASLIANTRTTSDIYFGSGTLLDDLVMFVRQKPGNKLIFIGDAAQLPPVGLTCSPAMEVGFLEGYGHVTSVEMREVVRQSAESGILYNANKLRQEIMDQLDFGLPEFEVERFDDIERVTGMELIESISDAMDKYGRDEVVVLCYSNKRAYRYNMGIRSKIFFDEEELVRGEKLMIVKNNYSFVENIKELDFIANGDIAQLLKIHRYTERYGLHYADAVLSLPEYNDIEIDVKVILDTLSSDAPSLTREQQNQLWEGINADYSHIASRRKRYEEIRKDPFYGALQIKYATATTCHKSQGGQWDCVFIDRAFWNGDMTVEDRRWLYTALTRAKKKVYLVNFDDEFFVG